MTISDTEDQRLKKIDHQSCSEARRDVILSCQPTRSVILCNQEYRRVKQQVFTAQAELTKLPNLGYP